MLKVKTVVQPSSIQGLGCFAAEPIKRGAVVWEFTRGYDQSFTKKQFNQLTGSLKTHFRRYAFFSKWEEKLIYCSDNAKFINHSCNPNTIDVFIDCKHYTIATRNIKRGEEMTSNYNSFCK